MSKMQGENHTSRRLPQNLYDEMLKFFRRTSLPRIQKQRAEECRNNEVENNTPSETGR